jgi:hypothetical protein
MESELKYYSSLTLGSTIVIDYKDDKHALQVTGREWRVGVVVVVIGGSGVVGFVVVVVEAVVAMVFDGGGGGRLKDKRGVVVCV